MTALDEVVERIPDAVREAAGILDYTGGSSVAEVADCAADQLSEWTVYLTEDEFVSVYAAVTAYVLGRFGFDLGASDGTDITVEQLAAVAVGEES